MSENDTEYTDQYATGLELMWGEGFLSPGGSEEIHMIVGDLDFQAKDVLDIGSGLGGPAVCLVLQHGAGHVVGVDVESLNVERATNYAAKVGLSERLTFQMGDGGKLAFEDDSFDVVFSKDAITQAPNKEEIFHEAYRVLRHDGWIAMSDWFRGSEPFTEIMKEWMAQAGVHLEFVTLDETATLLRAIGFVDIAIDDRNEWYRGYSKREAERMAGDDRHHFDKLLGREETDSWINGTNLKHQAVAQGQLRPGHLRARKP